MKFALAIPTLNRKDLFSPSLYRYQQDFPETKIYVVDNGNQGLDEFIHTENVELYIPSKNMGVAASWNFMLDKIFETHDFAIVMNDDIYWGAKEKQVEEFLNASMTHFCVCPMDWCLFIISKELYKRVGKFDESFFPAYFEDNDYAYRMKQIGFSVRKSMFLVPLIHRASQTMEKDSSVRKMFKDNKAKYIEKWGGEPLQEKFKNPYNAKKI